MHRAATRNGICEDTGQDNDPVWECDCERGYEELPTVHFEFVNGSQNMGNDSHGVHIGPSAPNHRVVKMSLSPGEYMVPRGNGRCIFGFMSADFMNSKYGGMWLLGDRFLSNRYTIYDYDRGYVGFSAAIRTPPSWFERHWQVLALVCGVCVALLAIASSLCVRRKRQRQRRRSAVQMSVGIHWSDPLGDTPPLY